VSAAAPAAVGVDLGGTNLKFALVTADGSVISQRVEPTAGAEGHAAVLRRVAEGVRRLAADAPVDAPVRAVGVGLPADLDAERGVVRELPNLPGRWLGVPVSRIVEEATRLPVSLINDAKAFAFAEHALGAACGAAVAVCVTVGTGIGAGIVVDGRLVFGAGGVAGEVGHVVLLPSGPRCTCGNRGCVEALASGPAIAAEAVRRIRQGFTTDLVAATAGDLNRVTPELVAGAAVNGDGVAAEIIADAGRWLGVALAGVVGVLNPEVIVVGGGLSQAGEPYLRAIEAAIREHARLPGQAEFALRPAALGYDAGVIGAALWALRSDAVTRPPAPKSPTRS
jgi:glucokinase